MERTEGQEKWTRRAKQSDHDAVVCNGRYAATVTSHGVFIQCLKGYDEPRLVHPRSNGSCSVALSRLDLDALAITDATRVVVRDLHDRRPPITLRGNGRAALAVTWSHHNANLLAVAFVDGVIGVWSIADASRPLHCTAVNDGIVRALSFSEAQPGQLAIMTQTDVHVWPIDSSGSPTRINLEHGIGIDAFVWHPFIAHRALTAWRDGSITTWDVSDALLASKRFDTHAGFEDDGIFGLPEDLVKPLSPTWRLFFSLQIRQVDWMGEHGILVLSTSGKELSLYDARDAMSSSSSIWEHTLNYELLHFRFSGNNEGAVTVLRKHGKEEKLIFPPHILQMVGWSEFVSSRRSSSVDEESEMWDKPEVQTTSPRAKPALSTMPSMRPISIADMRLRREEVSKESLHSFGHSPLPAAIKSASHSPMTALQRSEPPSTPPSGTMLSTHGLTHTPENEHDSPMPFLSPGVPARVSSPRSNIVLPPVTESLYLSPQNDSSTETLPPWEPKVSVQTLPSTLTNDNDSDSDDETFAGEGLNGSGTLMPGAVNVPLPKSCGALFAPNGVLITFFPPKPKLAVLREQGQIKDSTKEEGTKARKMAVLFPGFGNLAGDLLQQATESESDDDVSSRMDDALELLPRLTLQPASLSSQPAWPIKMSLSNPTDNHVKVIVNLREVPEIDPTQRKLAESYRIMCDSGESGTELCNKNALVARDAGLEDIADAWVVLGILLEETVPLKAMALVRSGTDAYSAVKHVPEFKRHDSGVELVAQAQASSLFGKASWRGHAFGATWLVRNILEDAEQRADIQLLAVMSAVLADPSSKALVGSRPESVARKLPNFQPDFLQQQSSGSSVKAIDTTIPPFGANSARPSSVEESPTKLIRSSRASSRNPSAPTTPFLGSSSSTPPFNFSMPPRQSSRLSASGSASPEHLRGSFSAAAKYYAQSITDKFNSYGTSPPAKKLSISPGNELSSSLPTAAASGSWNKSVSFASTATTGGESRRSLEYIPGDVDDSDSDDTIEEGSMPQMLGSVEGRVVVRTKNQQYLSDDVSGGGRAPLFDHDLAAKAHLWRLLYADLLRSWSLDLQAAEMEKISSLSSRSFTVPQVEDTECLTLDSSGANATCCICACVINKLEQVCQFCLHANHMACVEAYVDTEDGSFECPSGCGCKCDVEVQHTLVEDESRPDEVAAP